MELGAFSISLAVKNIETSRAFYEKFGFEVVGGDASQNWLILRNSDHTKGVELLSEADENSKGPASFIAVDPDGNPILVDRHV